MSAITTADLDRVGAFLHQNLNARISSRKWAAAAFVPWSVDAPNHGFMLLDGSDIVGVYLALLGSMYFVPACRNVLFFVAACFFA